MLQENLHIRSVQLPYLQTFFSFLDPVKRSKALGALHLHKTCITIYYASVWLQKRIRLTLKEETEPSRLSTDHQSIAIRLIAWSHY